MANFAQIKQRYSENPLPILRQLVGAGEIRGKDYVALNPTRNDRHRGSFRIDIATGKFYDFATNDKGGSIIDLAAYVYNCGVVEAARQLENLFPFLARVAPAGCVNITPSRRCTPHMPKSANKLYPLKSQ